MSTKFVAGQKILIEADVRHNSDEDGFLVVDLKPGLYSSSIFLSAKLSGIYLYEDLINEEFLTENWLQNSNCLHVDPSGNYTLSRNVFTAPVMDALCKDSVSLTFANEQTLIQKLIPILKNLKLIP